MNRDLRRQLNREWGEASRRVLVWSSASLAAMIGGAVISNERDRTYLLLAAAPFLGFFLLSSALRLTAWFSRPAGVKQAPLLPESVVKAAQSRFNASIGASSSEDERVKPIGNIVQDERSSTGKKPPGR